MTAATRVALELAGMISQQGRLGDRIATDFVVRPDRTAVKLDVRRDVLVYDTRVPMLSDVQRADALDQFVRLETALANDVLRFATRYGVLSVEAIRTEGLYEESLESWRNLASRARATLALAAAIHQGEPTRSQDWQTLEAWFYPWCARVKERSGKAHRAAERRQLADVLNAWLEFAELRPSFSWQYGISFTNLEGVDCGSITLLGVVALQLVRAVARARTIATCSGCGATYLRKRQAPMRRANYCKKCGIKAAWRDAQARHRSRHSEKSRGAK